MRYHLFVLAALVALPQLASAAAVADLTNWIGVNHVNPEGNDYEVITQASAGGTFTQRPAVPAYLADTSLSDNGTTFDNTSVLTATGTISFDANVQNSAAIVDPRWNFGFFDTNDIQPTRKFGFSFADQTPNSFRVQLILGGTEVQEGIYTFQFGLNDEFAGPGFMRIQFTQGAASFADEIIEAPVFTANAFGFSQFTDTAERPEDFQVVVSDLTYTGATLIPEPGSFALAGGACAGLLMRRRRCS